jgi:hypothetical protein
MDTTVLSFLNRRLAVLERVNRELSQRLLYLGQWIFEVVNHLFDVEPIVMDQLTSMVKLGPKRGLTPNKLYTVFFSREHCYHHNIVVMFKILVKNIVQNMFKSRFIFFLFC